jgi:hypothetical protein
MSRGPRIRTKPDATNSRTADSFAERVSYDPLIESALHDPSTSVRQAEFKQGPRLLNQVRDCLRRRHCSLLRTQKA